MLAPRRRAAPPGPSRAAGGHACSVNHTERRDFKIQHTTYKIESSLVNVRLTMSMSTEQREHLPPRLKPREPRKTPHS